MKCVFYIYKFCFFIFLCFVGLYTHGADPWATFYKNNTDAYEKFLCQKLSQKNCTNTKDLENILMPLCQKKVRGLNCERVEKNPAYKKYIQKCTKETLCVDDQRSMDEDLKTCFEFIPDSIHNIEKYFKADSGFYKKCNQSLECKRELIKDHPQYKNYSDEVLEKTDISLFTVIETRNFRNALGQIQRAPTPSKFLFDRKDNFTSGESAGSTKVTAVAQKMFISTANFSKALWTLSKELLPNEFEDYKCLNSLGQLKM